MNRKNQLIVFTATVIVSILFIWAGYAYFGGYGSEEGDNQAFVSAKILSVDSTVREDGYFGGTDIIIYFTARITGGEQKGNTITGYQKIDSMFVIAEQEVEQGDSVLITYMENMDTGGYEWVFGSYNRVPATLWLCGAFLAVVAAIGLTKGFRTILALVLTCLFIFLVYVPSILSGFNVYLSTSVIGFAVTVMSLLLINGADKKTLCAVVGTLGGVLLTALLALMTNSVMKLTGFIDEQYVYLALINPDRPLDLVAIAWGGMVLGALGAVMDVAMTISSSMHELAEHMAGRTYGKMFRSGMNIGRDAIGTMSNTLILAYIGGSLALVLLLLTYTKDIFYLFSMEMIAAQVVQAITGSMGILFAVPASAAFSAYLYNRPAAVHPNDITNSGNANSADTESYSADAEPKES